MYCIRIKTYTGLLWLLSFYNSYVQNIDWQIRPALNYNLYVNRIYYVTSWLRDSTNVSRDGSHVTMQRMNIRLWSSASARCTACRSASRYTSWLSRSKAQTGPTFKSRLWLIDYEKIHLFRFLNMWLHFYYICNNLSWLN